MEISQKTLSLFCSILLISILLFTSCNKEIDLKNFNKETWVRDFNGCDGSREVQYGYLEQLKAEFVGMRESQLLEILGKPNKQELAERGKKTYFYYILPGKQCLFRKNETKLLVVDFDALDRVSLFSLKVE
jgi:outer membrane protein assembly factor BamE (lipoprotein component of BamABCDE complex)